MYRFEENPKSQIPNPESQGDRGSSGVGNSEFSCDAEASERDGFEAYGFRFSALTMSVIAFCARTLLPASSSGGETTAMPNLPGATAMMPPPTPLLAGRPV